MSTWNQPYVIDRDAYHERMRTLIASGIDAKQASGLASEHAYRTPFSLAATAAIRGDWEPAKELCRRDRDEHGQEHARLLMRSIQAAVKEKMAFASPTPSRGKSRR